MAEPRCSPDEFPPAAICDFNDGWEAIRKCFGTYSFGCPMIKRGTGRKQLGIVRAPLLTWQPTQRCCRILDVKSVRRTQKSRLIQCILASKAPALAARPHADRGQRIRLLQSKDNHNAGTLFGGCKRVADYNLDNDHTRIEPGKGRRDFDTVVHQMRAVYNRRRYTMDFANLPNLADDGLTDNGCQPVINGVSHPGFALLNEDQWFLLHGNEAALTAGWAQGASKLKQRADWIEELGKLAIVDTNSTRLASREELRDQFGFDECADDACSRELEALKAVIETMKEMANPTVPVEVEAQATLNPGDNPRVLVPISQPGSDFVEPSLPVQTTRSER